ncbi:MAG: ABC transporter permease [Lentisphaerae bacterium]|jgi:ribose transport system permease protein|nr:ABC transporter permease [Lentisphaerota bacterium]
MQIVNKRIRKIARRLNGPYLALTALLIVCTFTSEVFFTVPNLLNITRQVSYSGIIALGMTFVIVAGGIDLSVGSLFALAGVSAALAIQHWSLPLSVKLGLSLEITGVIIGLLAAMLSAIAGTVANALIIVYGKLPPFIATLGTLSIFRSLALFSAASGTLSVDNNALKSIGTAQIFGIPLPAVVMLFLVVIFEFILSATVFGRHVCALGSNERVARFAGIRVNAVKFITYILPGLCIGISAFMFLTRLGSVSSSDAGMSYELDAIAAVIIGGASMSGGRGSLRGTLAGILILGVVSNILDLWGVSANLKGVVKGLVIIVSVLIQRKEKTS